MRERDKIAAFEAKWKPTVWYADRGYMLQLEYNCWLFMRHSEITRGNHTCKISLITTQDNKSETCFLYTHKDEEATLSEVLEAAAKYALEHAEKYMRRKAESLQVEANSCFTAADKLRRAMVNMPT